MSDFNFISSASLAEQVGITHKKLKELIRKNKVSVIPAGLQMVEGKSQRVVLVDKSNVDEIFSKSMKPLSRKASKGGKKLKSNKTKSNVVKAVKTTSNVKTPSRKTDGVLVSNKRVSKSGDVKWGGYNADRTYDWEEELVDILKEHDTNILGVVRDTLIDKFGGSEKTWKNRISQMKKKHGFNVNTQNRGQAKKEGWVK